MTVYDKIKLVLAERGILCGYRLEHMPAGNWRLIVPNQKTIYGSCARAIIRAIRRRYRK